MEKADHDALVNAGLALEAVIRTAALALQVVEDRLADAKVTPAKEKDPFETFTKDELPNCEHLNCVEKQTMGMTWFMCQDCKRMIEPNEQ